MRMCECDQSREDFKSRLTDAANASIEAVFQLASHQTRKKMQHWRRGSRLARLGIGTREIEIQRGGCSGRNMYL